MVSDTRHQRPTCTSPPRKVPVASINYTEGEREASGREGLRAEGTTTCIWEHRAKDANKEFCHGQILATLQHQLCTETQKLK